MTCRCRSSEQGRYYGWLLREHAPVRSAAPASIVHQVLSCRSPYGIVGPPLPACNRRLDRGYSCVEDGPGTLPGTHDSGDFDEITVPQALTS